MTVEITAQAVIHNPSPEAVDAAQDTLRLINPLYVQQVRFGSPYAAKPEKHLRFYLYDSSRQILVVPRRWWLDNRASFPDAAPICKCANVSGDFPAPQLDPFDYQQDALDAMLAQVNQNDALGLPTDGTIILATSGGKTILGMLAAYHLQAKTLVVVPTQEIEEAWLSDFEKVFQSDRKTVGRIRASKYSIGEHFTIASIQTLIRRDAKIWADQFGLCIYDELHRLGGTKFAVTAQTSNAMVRLGLSATPKRKDGMLPMIRWHLGKDFYHDTTPRNSVPLVYHPVMLKIPCALDDKDPWQLLINKLCNSPRRNELIVELVRRVVVESRGGVLVTSCRVEHIGRLAEMIRQTVGCTVATLTGASQDRKALYDEIKNGKYKVTVATQAIVSEGASVPYWWHLVITTPFTDHKTMEQLKGRPIRLAKGKSLGHVWDLIDDTGLFRYAATERYGAIKCHIRETQKTSMP